MPSASLPIRILNRKVENLKENNINSSSLLRSEKQTASEFFKTFDWNSDGGKKQMASANVPLSFIPTLDHSFDLKDSRICQFKDLYFPAS